MLKLFFIIIVIDRELCTIKNGDDTNVLGTISTFAPSDKAGYAPEGKERKGKERKRKRKSFFPKYQVNKINQNYNNAVCKWVKSDEFLRLVEGGGTPHPNSSALTPPPSPGKNWTVPPLATNLCYAPDYLLLLQLYVLGIVRGKEIAFVS